jgi:hypothetical protein
MVSPINIKLGDRYTVDTTNLMVRTDLPLRRSIPAGLDADVLGYVIAVGATVGGVGAVTRIEMTGLYRDPTPLGGLLATTPSEWVVGGWLFYDAHLIPTSLPTADVGAGMARLTNRHLLLDLGGPLFALYLLPPLVLIATGYLVARVGETYGARGDTFAGASVAAGYGPLVILSAFLLTAEAGLAGVVASPVGLQSVFLGIGYPLVFGAIGGTIADYREYRESASATDV